jgi:hypothetical protein
MIKHTEYRIQRWDAKYKAWRQGRRLLTAEEARASFIKRLAVGKELRIVKITTVEEVIA